MTSLAAAHAATSWRWMAAAIRDGNRLVVCVVLASLSCTRLGWLVSRAVRPPGRPARRAPGREGLETELTTHPPGREEGAAAGAPAVSPRPSVSVRGNVQEGIGNVIDVQRGDAEVVENLQEGIDQQIRVAPDES